jgi:hypothetical protein
MSVASRPSTLLRSAAIAFVWMVLVAAAVSAATSVQTPTWPGDASVPGIQAARSIALDPSEYDTYLPPETIVDGARRYVAETRALGLARRSGTFSILSDTPLNVNANVNHAGDAVGETNSEVAVAVFGDTVVIGWNDSRGFVAGNTVSSYAYSTNGGASFTDGGNMVLALPTDQAFGDAGIDTDEQGYWYYNQIYTRTAGNPNPTAEQDIAVHRGHFIAGVLTWDPPVVAAQGNSALGNLDKCLLACDRVTRNVYVGYLRFFGNGQIEIVRSVNQGVNWSAPIVLDNTIVPTSSKSGTRPFCGPNGEVYVIWEKGANTINCPDGAGNVASTTGQIAFSRSLDFGATYSPLAVIGTVDQSWTASGPGDLRERGNEFPDIAVDRSGGPFNGNIYVTWHESAPWTANLNAGPVKAEAADGTNGVPGGAELFNVGDNVTGSSSSTADLDYWQFSATQGQTLFFNLDPQAFNCGVTGTTRGLRMRLFATQTPYPNPNGFPDTLLAASALGAFAQRIVWTAPKTGTYLVRLQPSTTAIGTYTLRVRNLTFLAPNPARDVRDVVYVQSSNQGGTWSAERLLSDGPAGTEDRRPFIAADGLGHVHAFWHDGRIPGLGSNAALTSIFGTTSRDGGATWTPNYCVTDELSFFSFNTLAVPNLGDYNQAAANAAGVVHPAWSDQRISTGDVRVPNTNTFSAGLGPEAYTTGVQFALDEVCPADTTGDSSTQVTRKFRISNIGTVPDKYNYSVTGSAAWPGTPVNGTTPTLSPASFFDVFVTLDLPADCTPPSNTLTLSVSAIGDPNVRTCTSVVSCNIATGVEGPAPRTLEFRIAGRNPFAGATMLSYSLPHRAPVKIDVFSVNGRRVATLVDRTDGPGVYNIPFEMHARDGNLGAGIYMIRLSAGNDRRFLRAIALE